MDHGNDTALYELFFCSSKKIKKFYVYEESCIITNKDLSILAKGERLLMGLNISRFRFWYKLIKDF